MSEGAAFSTIFDLWYEGCENDAKTRNILFEHDKELLKRAIIFSNI